LTSRHNQEIRLRLRCYRRMCLGFKKSPDALAKTGANKYKASGDLLIAKHSAHALPYIAQYSSTALGVFAVVPSSGVLTAPARLLPLPSSSLVNRSSAGQHHCQRGGKIGGTIDYSSTGTKEKQEWRGKERKMRHE